MVAGFRVDVPVGDPTQGVEVSEEDKKVADPIVSDKDRLAGSMS